MTASAALHLPQALLSPLVLGESSGGVVMAAAAPLCAAGVLLVAQPTFLFGGGSRALSMAGVGIGILQASSGTSYKNRACPRALPPASPARLARPHTTPRRRRRRHHLAATSGNAPVF